MTNCIKVQGLLPDYIAGRTSATDSVLVAEHLDRCAVCKLELRRVRSAINVLRSMPAPDVAPARYRALTDLRRAVHMQPTRRRMDGLGRSAIMAVATSCILMWLAFSTSHRTEVPAIHEEIEIVTAAHKNALPSADELDAMESMHAVQSISATADDCGVQQETLADATSRAERWLPTTAH